MHVLDLGPWTQGGSPLELLLFLLLPALLLCLLEGKAAFRVSTCSGVPLIGIN